MQVSDRNFGLLIAYIIPGFIALIGLSGISPTINLWLGGFAAEQMPSVAGFLYVTIASVGLGMTASAIRFVVIDKINELTGLKRPAWDDRQLQANYQAYTLVIEQHYRYYQFYANSLIALLIAYAAHHHQNQLQLDQGLIEIVLAVIGIFFWLMARDTLRKYYLRATSMLAEQEHNHGKRSTPKRP